MTEHKKFPTLYKVHKIKGPFFWRAEVEYADATYCLKLSYGWCDGGVSTKWIAFEGTSDVCILHAKNSTDKKLKEGWVPNISDAPYLEDNTAMVPNYSLSTDTFPKLIQKEEPGIVCVAVVTNGVCTLWNSDKERIRSVPHIIEGIEDGLTVDLPEPNAVIVGKLQHKKEDFLKKSVEEQEPVEGHHTIRYCMMDYPSVMANPLVRIDRLCKDFKKGWRANRENSLFSTSGIFIVRGDKDISRLKESSNVSSWTTISPDTYKCLEKEIDPEIKKVQQKYKKKSRKKKATYKEGL